MEARVEVLEGKVDKFEGKVDTLGSRVAVTEVAPPRVFFFFSLAFLPLARRHSLLFPLYCFSPQNVASSTSARVHDLAVKVGVMEHIFLGAKDGQKDGNEGTDWPVEGIRAPAV
eukprot:1935238-Rhodomonas_salina.1